MKNFWKLLEPLNMPNVDLANFSDFGINPPGGKVGATLASSATITITHPIHHVSGTASINTIVPPYTGFVGRITLITDGALTFTSAGGTSPNAISTVFTAVSGQAVDVVTDGALWYPKISD